MASATMEWRGPGAIGQVGFDAYTVIVLGFRLDNRHRDKAADALNTASHKLVQAFPWLAGQVVIEGRTESKSGVYKIVPYPHQAEKSLVRHKDLSTRIPDYDTVVKAGAPYGMLDGDLLCSVSPMGYPMSRAVSWPVFVIEANYINNGLLLCFSTQHNAADMTGQGHLIEYFAQLLRGSPLNPSHITDGNFTPDIQPLTSSDPPPNPLSDLRRPSTLSTVYPQPRPPRDSAPWLLFRFPPDACSRLKTTSKAYSTNDAVTALFALRLTIARLNANILSQSDLPIKCERAKDMRAALGFSARYLGATAGCCTTLITPEMSLEDVSVALRKDLGTVDNHYARSLATALTETDDSTTIFYGSDVRFGKDLVVSSWGKLPLAKLSFGSEEEVGFGDGGYPGFIRRPNFPPAPVAYILPIGRDGTVEVAACLDPESAEALRKDAEWKEFAVEIR